MLRECYFIFYMRVRVGEGGGGRGVFFYSENVNFFF